MRRQTKIGLVSAYGHWLGYSRIMWVGIRSNWRSGTWIGTRPHAFENNFPSLACYFLGLRGSRVMRYLSLQGAATINSACGK